MDKEQQLQAQDEAKEEARRKQLSQFDRYLGATLQSVEDGLLESGSETKA